MLNKLIFFDGISLNMKNKTYNADKTALHLYSDTDMC